MISNYIEALANPSGRFRTLGGLRAVPDAHGEPCYVSASGGRVVFEVILEDNSPAKLVCFTRGLPVGVPRPAAQLLPDEIYVYDAAGRGAYYPVMLLLGAQDFSHNSMPGPRDTTYEWVGEWEEGRAAVRSASGYYGLIDTEGVEIVAPQYDDLSWDGSRFAYVEQEGRYGCLDRLGAVVVPLEYDWMGEFNAGFAVVRRADRYGYVNQAGELVGKGLAFADAISPAADGTACVTLPDGRKEQIKLF